VVRRETLKKVLAREWLTLVAGFLVGFSLVPIFVYTFISPKDYTSRHSLTDAYTELLSWLFGKEGGGGILISMAIILAPYLLYQFARSVFWSIQAMRKN
jgi:hypothetical protein